jgi:hypothetical protein
MNRIPVRMMIQSPSGVSQLNVPSGDM